MKLSVAAAVLVSSSTVVAFQQPNSAASLRGVGLHAVAFDPSKAVIPTPPQQQQPEEPKELTIDMAGIALSVSSK
jgi:hypothetical protein